VAGYAGVAAVAARKWIAENVPNPITPAEARVVKHDFEADSGRHIEHSVFQALLSEVEQLRNS